MHSNDGKNEYEVAISTPKIKDSSDEEIKQVLRFAMILIGIRANTVAAMDDEEKQILVGFLKSKFGWFTLGEIKTAFIKACAGELDVDARPFENFTCEYIGRIMKAYKEWATDEAIKHKSKLRNTPYKALEYETETDGVELADMYYQEYLRDDFNFRVATIMCWDKMKYKFNIIFSNDENSDIIQQAKKICLADCQEIVEKYSHTNRMSHHLQAQMTINEIKNCKDESLLGITQIMYCCKRLGLQHWFKLLKEQNVKSIKEYAEKL